MRVDIADMVLDELQAGTIDRKAAVRLLQRIGQQTPIAVVGMGSLMGETDDYREIWEHYRTGGSFIDRASQERGDLVRSSMPPQTMESPTQMTKGNFLSDIHTFDWDLFDYTEEEARSFFPHARLALMAAFRAVEDAGLTGEHAAGHTTGVWVGYNFVRDQMNSYLGMGVRRGEDPEAMMFGSWTSGIATRISRAFDFRGPSQMVDGACASSAITIANACRELQNGTIDAALTGGFFLDLTPIHLLNQPGVFATATDDSVPKLYSRDNVGGFGGESYGFIVLKTLDRALKDGDRIHGVIRGWSESNAGGNGGFDQTAPESVRAAVRDVLKSSKTSVDDIGVVYGEGFAQPIEEALETNGLLQGIASLTDRKQFAALTTASSAMGYMQSAIGVLQMQLLVQAVRDATIPPLLYFDNPTDLVDLADSPFYVPTEPQEWPEPAGGERRGLQYSNAFGGFYLTFVVGPPPAAEDPSTDTAGPRTDTADSGADTAPEAGGPLVFAASSPTEEGLRQKLQSDLELLRTAAPEDIAAMCFTSCTRQFVHTAFRAAFVADSSEDLIAAVEALLGAEQLPGHTQRPGCETFTGAQLSPASGRRSGDTGQLSAAEAAQRFCRAEPVAFTQLFPPADQRFVPLSRHQMNRRPVWVVPKITISQMKEAM